MKSQTKVVFFANFSGLVKYLWVKQGACPRVERLKGALDLGPVLTSKRQDMFARDKAELIMPLKW